MQPEEPEELETETTPEIVAELEAAARRFFASVVIEGLPADPFAATAALIEAEADEGDA